MGFHKTAPKQSYEIVPSTHTGSERVVYSLVGHGAGTDYGHEHMRFGTRDEAMEHMAAHGLTHAKRPSDDPWRGMG